MHVVCCIKQVPDTAQVKIYPETNTLIHSGVVIGEVREIKIDSIRPNYRLVFEEQVILRFCDDIKLRVLQEPILVELIEYWFQIVDGEKRWRACKKIGLSKIKAVILEVI